MEGRECRGDLVRRPGLIFNHVMSSLSLGLLLLGAISSGKPTVAILPPVAIDGSESWLGIAVADNLAAALLPQARLTGKDYALNVFSWRETASAARAEGLDVTRP